MRIVTPDKRTPECEIPIPERKEVGTKRILVPVKGTPEAEIPLELAAELAKEFDAEIYLLRVVEWIDAFSGLRFDPDVLRMMEDAARYVNNLASRVDLPADRVRTLVSWSVDVAKEIISVAEKEDVDLIIMGSSRKGRFQRLLQGSVHQNVLKSQICAVTCVPMDAPQGNSSEPATTATRSRA